jgi:GNAT superfamily N-acetyltransferase
MVYATPERLTVDRLDDYLALLGQLSDIGTPDYTCCRDLLIDGSCEIWIIVVNDLVVACGSVYFLQKMSHNTGRVAMIEDVVVDTDYRQSGYGSVIVRHLVDWARANGCYKVVLTCREEHRAFYEKLGFDQTLVSKIRYF